jgi:hypothetical protein
VEAALSLRAMEGLLVLFLRVGIKSERGYRRNIMNKGRRMISRKRAYWDTGRRRDDDGD